MGEIERELTAFARGTDGGLIVTAIALAIGETANALGLAMAASLSRADEAIG